VDIIAGKADRLNVSIARVSSLFHNKALESVAFDNGDHSMPGLMGTVYKGHFSVEHGSYDTMSPRNRAGISAPASVLYHASRQLDLYIINLWQV
jgi:hypothetical protein